MAAFDNQREEVRQIQDKLYSFIDNHEEKLLEAQQKFSDPTSATDWNPFNDVIGLELGTSTPPFGDQFSFADLLGPEKMNQKIFYRVLLLFATLTAEMESLSLEVHEVLVPPLLLFMDENGFPDGISNDEAQKGFTNLVPHLEVIWYWYKRVEHVVVYALRQLACFYSSEHAGNKQNEYYSLTNVSFPRVWQSLARLLGAVVTLDQVIIQNHALQQGRKQTFKLLSFMSTYQGDELPIFSHADNLKAFQDIILKLERTVLCGRMLERIVHQHFDKTLQQIDVSNNSYLFAQFAEALNFMVSEIQEATSAGKESTCEENVLGTLALHNLCERVFRPRSNPNGRNTLRGSVDRENRLNELFQSVIALHKSYPIVCLQGTCTLYTLEWLVANYGVDSVSKACESTVSRKMEKESIEALRKERASNFKANIKQRTTHISTWMADLQTTQLSDSQHEKEFIKTMILLLQKGLVFAQGLRYALVHLMSLYNCADGAKLSLPILESILQGVELLLMIRSTFHSKLGVIAGTFNILVQSIAYVIEKHIYNVHVRLEEKLDSSRRGTITSEAVFRDQLAAAGQIIGLLHKPFTDDTFIALDLAFSITFNERGVGGAQSGEHPCFSKKEYDDVSLALVQLKRVANFQNLLEKLTDCSFIYWFRESLYPCFFGRFYNFPQNAPYLPYCIAAMQDACETIKKAKHLKKNIELQKSYKKYVRKLLFTEIVEPICTDVENDLRLHTHAIVMSEAKPRSFKDFQQTKDLSPFLQLPPFHFFGSWFDIGSQVEYYLSRQFYNLNALAPKDWKVYSEMRRLAEVRYGLRVIDGRLPGSIVDQGLDVLSVTENIHVFISHYTYNINEQLFVQRASRTEAKHLQTLQIRHVANSIRTHGTGILHTAVNYVYKCLLRKLAILSHFLNNEQIKSCLLREVRFVQKQKENHKLEYPFARASQLIHEIMKLGCADDGNSFLFKCTQLVAEIGNALGFMRTMRSSGLSAVADAALYLPSLNPTKIPSLTRRLQFAPTLPAKSDLKAKHAEKADDEKDNKELENKEEDEETVQKLVRECTVEASQHTDHLAKIISQKMSDGSDYFLLLQDALGRKLRTEKYSHLRLFYCLIPAMCLCFTKYLVKEKEILMKKDKEGVFTDDGFALGCAFLVSLFGVQEHFQSLHWFDTVREYYASRLAALSDTVQGRSDVAPQSHNEDEANGVGDAAYLTKAVMEVNLAEHIGIERAFISSKVFFFKAKNDADRDSDALEDISAIEEDSDSESNTSQ